MLRRVSVLLLGFFLVSGLAFAQERDAFSRWRVSNPTTLFDVSFQYDLQPLLIQETETDNGSVDHAPTYSGALLATTDAGDAAIMQSRQYLRYTPGKSQLIFLTTIFGDCDGVVKRAGYFDDNNGIFLQQDADCDVNWVRRSNVSGAVVNEVVDQASWNIDTLQGGWNSKLVLDPSKNMILVIDLQWLGLGRVRVGFDIDGDVIYTHQFNHANVLDVPYMRTASLPVRWEIDGDVADNMYAICASVISEGGDDYSSGLRFSHSLTTAVSAGDATDTFLVAYRPAGTFNSIVNRTQTDRFQTWGAVTGNTPVLFKVWYNATVTGGSWAAVNASSAVEVNTSGSVSGGLLLATFVVPATVQGKGAETVDILDKLPFVLLADGSAYANIVITGAGSNSYAGMSWTEVR